MPTHPLTPKLALQVVAVIQSNPEQGVPVLWTLLEMGGVSPESPVGKGGPALADKVLELAVEEAQKDMNGPLARAVFRTDIQKWGGPGFFCRQGAEGEWIPMQWLRILSKRPKEAIKGGTRVSKQLDDWFSQTLPLLTMEEQGTNETLAGALALGIPDTTDLFWKKGDQLAMIGGKPVIAHARSGDFWHRFLADGGDPTHRIDGTPLWRHLVPHNPTMAPLQNLAGDVERWAWAWLGEGNGRDEDRQWLEKSIDRRLAGKGGLHASDWLSLLAATPFPGPRWETAKDQVPAWETVARTNRDIAFLAALEKSELGRRVNEAHLARVRAEIFPLIVACPSDLEKITACIRDLFSDPSNQTGNKDKPILPVDEWKVFLRQGKYPKDVEPAILSFVGHGLDKKLNRELEAIAQAYPEAWWGAEGNLVEEQVLDRVLILSLQKKMDPQGTKSRGQQGIARTFSRLTNDRHDYPAIRLALGILLMLWSNKDEEALGLLQGSEKLLDPRTAKGSERLTTIRSLVSGWNRKRRDRIETFLSGAEMHATIPQARETAKPKVRF